MTRIRGEVTIDVPVEEVFDLVADERNEPRYNPRIIHAVKVSEGPIGRGSQFLAEPGGMGARGQMTVEVLEYDRPHHLHNLVRSSYLRCDGALTFEEVHGGTRLRWDWDMGLVGPIRVLTPLLALVGPRWERRNWIGLKQFMERRAEPLPPNTQDTRQGRLHRFDKWMYRGGRPNRVARILNRISAIQYATGIAVPERAVTLEVIGRRSGRVISFPLVLTRYGGERYLVAMLGEHANWVHNVRAAHGRAVLRHGRREAVYLDEIDPSRRAPILRRFLELAPGARGHLPVERGAPLVQFERIAAQYPVFRITPDAGDRRAPEA